MIKGIERIRQIPELERIWSQVCSAAIDLQTAVNQNAWQKERALSVSYSEEEVARREHCFNDLKKIFQRMCTQHNISVADFTARDVYKKEVR